MKSKNVIELNGKRYDAVTGNVLGVGSAPLVSAKGTVDGFFRTTRTTAAKATKPAAQKITVLSTPSTHHIPTEQSPGHHRIVAGHARAHTPQSAVTLMRTAVKRPKPGLKQQTTVQGSLQHKVPSLITPKKSVYSLDTNRLTRSKTIERSPLVTRHNVHTTHIPVTFAPLAVQPVPVRDEPAVPPPQQTNKPLDMFEHAVANAGNYIDIKAHHAHFRKQARKYGLSMAAGTLALLVIAGFAAYQNNPRLQVKVASLKSGVNASLPNFKASGFDYNGVKAADGKIAVGFKADNAQYQLTQQTTNLSSDDIIQNLAATDASGTPNYTTLQAGGITVYRFSNNEATWVANGNWYTVTGTGALTNSQVAALVKNTQ